MTTTLHVVGKPVPRVEGADKVTGKALYAADVSLPGMLWGRTLRSPHPHARIVSIDASRARALPGVHAVITGRDLPENTLIGRAMRDLPVLAQDKVRFIGDKVAVVAADDPKTAVEALRLIDVEYEELPAVFDPMEAMKDDAPRVHDDANAYMGHWQQVPAVPNLCSAFSRSHGDLDAAFAQAARVFEHTFRTQRIHHGYMEPHACTVRANSDGAADIWTSNKNPYNMRQQIADSLGMPAEQLVVHPVSIGGDFGGKGAPMSVPEAYLLSKATGRPVKMVFSYADELLAGNPRHPGVYQLRTAADREGRILGMDIRAVWNKGAYGAFMPVPMIMPMGVFSAASCYRVPAFRVESLAVYTNTVPGGHLRAPGSPQMVFALESHLDIIARELGMDPMDFRLRNVIEPGDAGPLGERYRGVRARETLERARQVSGWDSPKPGPFVGRGVAMYNRTTGHGKSSAQLRLDSGGAVTVVTPAVDAGQGASTAIRQIVAETLGALPDDVEIVLADTATLPIDAGTGHSRTTTTAGGAAWQVALQARESLLAMAAELLGLPQDRVVLADGFAQGDRGSGRISWPELASAVVRANGGPLRFETVYDAHEMDVSAFCTQVAEVAVDPETGQVRVLRIVTVHDTGTVINPIGHQGQIAGGVGQGIGFALMEDLPDEDGMPVALNLADYKLPTIADTVRLDTVLLEENPLGPAPFAGRGIGEISNCPTAAAIANAVADAVGARLSELPITAEKVLRALRRP